MRYHDHLTYSGVDVSREGSVRDDLTGIGVPGVGHGQQPENGDE